MQNEPQYAGSARPPRPGALFAISVLCGVTLAGLLVADIALPGDNHLLHLLSGAALSVLGAAAWPIYRNAGEGGRRRAAKDLESEPSGRSSRASDEPAKSRYLASFSHEIRSPLNAIYGYAQLVERDLEVNPREAAKVIRRCAEHLSSLIDGISDMTQLDNGVFRLKVEVVEFAPFLEQIVSMFEPAAAAKGIAFEYAVNGTLPQYVRMDQNRLRQVLINLLANAIKFTDHGWVRLQVGYRAQTARFEVTDTGPGIATADRERIFGRYQRGRDESRPGTGLGLPIARALVEILGGKLELESAPGHGTTFAATLMLSDVTDRLAHRAAARRVVGYHGTPRTVLVAEDDPEQLAFLSRLLASLGFNVITATNGRAALAAAANRHLDLAILDIAMPGLSGWQTASHLRQTHDPNLRILMLSGNAEEFHKPDFPVPVHDLFLVKPVEFGALIQAVGGLLRLSWNWAPADEAPQAVVAHEEGRIPLNAAAREHVERLREYLSVGYIRGIEDEIRRLQAADPQAGQLAEQLIVALDRFELGAMAQTLEEV